MGLFGRSFSPGKSPPKRSSSLSSLGRRDSERSSKDITQEFNKIKLNIGGQKSSFQDGEWIAESGSKSKGTSREISRLQQHNQTLQEENNLLKLKVEMLLDMLTEKSAEALIKEKEISKLKSRRK